MQQARAFVTGSGPARPARPQPPKLSDWSTPAVKDSCWSSFDFLLGAGMVVIQKNTHKILVVHESRKQYWFFPRGRKDIGESLEQTALRETYEESGYRAEFLPLLNPTHQPLAPDQLASDVIVNSEPVFMSLTAWKPRKRSNGDLEDHGGEYMTMWYAGQIAEDAVHESGTGMPDEKNYESYLLPFDEAFEKVYGHEQFVLSYVWKLYCNTSRYQESLRGGENAGSNEQTQCEP